VEVNEVSKVNTVNPADLVGVKLDKSKLLIDAKMDFKKMEQLVQTAKTGDQAATVKPSDKIDAKKLKEFVDAMNKFVMAFDSKWQFNVYQGTDQVWLRIVDLKTNEVIREVPGEDALALAAKIRDFVGLLFDKKV
jgi:flagellar protein FlaG